MKNWFVFGVLALLFLLGGCKRSAEKVAPMETEEVCVPVFEEDSAMLYIVRQCDFGPRTLGSKAHEDCAQFILRAFEDAGCEVMRQDASFRLYNGQVFDGCNLIASFNPEAKERVLLCAHWDSRPWADADKDPKNHRSPVPAANDGASGVAVMLEIARLLGEQPPSVGVDFICFDAEDAGVPDWDLDFDGSELEQEESWCLGSQFWAKNPHRVDFEFGILLDMVGGKGAQFYQEQYSLYFAQGVVSRVWEAAQAAGYASYFPATTGGVITDDHLPLNRIARIPTIDIIPLYTGSGSSFGPTWHTLDDTPLNIDKLTLKAVGQTLLRVIYSM